MQYIFLWESTFLTYITVLLPNMFCITVCVSNLKVLYCLFWAPKIILVQGICLLLTVSNLLVFVYFILQCNFLNVGVGFHLFTLLLICRQCGHWAM